MSIEISPRLHPLGKTTKRRLREQGAAKAAKDAYTRARVLSETGIPSRGIISPRSSMKHREAITIITFTREYTQSSLTLPSPARTSSASSRTRRNERRCGSPVARWKVSTDNEGSPANRFAYRSARAGNKQTESNLRPPDVMHDGNHVAPERIGWLLALVSPVSRRREGGGRGSAGPPCLPRCTAFAQQRGNGRHVSPEKGEVERQWTRRRSHAQLSRTSGWQVAALQPPIRAASEWRDDGGRGSS